jgi:hypothetical protein
MQQHLQSDLYDFHFTYTLYTKYFNRRSLAFGCNSVYVLTFISHNYFHKLTCITKLITKMDCFRSK